MRRLLIKKKNSSDVIFVFEIRKNRRILCTFTKVTANLQNLQKIDKKIYKKFTKNFQNPIALAKKIHLIFFPFEPEARA